MRLKARAIISFLRSDKSNSWVSEIVTYGEGGGEKTRRSANKLIQEKLKLQPYMFMGNKGDMYGLKVVDCNVVFKKNKIIKYL